MKAKTLPESSRRISHRPPASHRNRLPWVDAAKGLGIVAVVFGHLTPPGLDALHQWIYLFHMPLFFLLGGMFQKAATKESCFWDFLKKKAASRLIPYLIYSAVSLAVWYSI